jgi:hypothetical protein
MSEIFIGYREKDARRTPDFVLEAISQRCPNNVFLDRESLRAGPFRDQIDAELAKAKVFLFLIGPDWLTVKDGDGQPRLVDPNDVHRHEIATALRRGARVIPVLVGDADLPRANDLPDDIRTLPDQQARTLGDTRAERRHALDLIFKDFSSAGIPVLPPAPDPPRWPKLRTIVAAVVGLIFSFLFFGWVSVLAFRWKLGVPPDVRISPAFYLTASRQFFLGSSILAVAALVLLWVIGAFVAPFVPLLSKVRRHLGRAFHRLGDGPLADVSFLLAVSLLALIGVRYAGIFVDLATTKVGAYKPSAANDYYGVAMSGYITLAATMAALLAARLAEGAAIVRAFVRLGACIVMALFVAAVPYRLRVQNEAVEVGFPSDSTHIERAFILDFGYTNPRNAVLYIPARGRSVVADTVEKRLTAWCPPADGAQLTSVNRRTREIFADADCGAVK